MIVVAHQPQFLPWSGFWAKVSKSDLLILMPNVQWDKGQTSNRVKVLGHWLTLPVKTSESNTLMHMTYDVRGVAKIIKTLEQTLQTRKFKYGDRLDAVIATLMAVGMNQDNLAVLNTELVRTVSALLGLKFKLVVDEAPLLGETTTDRLRGFILRNTNTTDITYLSGAGGRAYLGPMAGIKTEYCEGAWEDCSIVQLIAREEDPLEFIRMGVPLRSSNSPCTKV